MELCLGNEPGVTSWGDAEKQAGLARRLLWNWAAFHEIIIQGLKPTVNWRSGFAIKFLFDLDVDRSPEPGFDEGNWDAPECRATAPDIESSSRAVGRRILAGRVELITQSSRREEEGPQKESEDGAVWFEARLLDSAAQLAGRAAALGAD
jgi:hypothetical protein